MKPPCWEVHQLGFTQMQKAVVRTAFPGQSKARGQQAEEELLAALNRSNVLWLVCKR